MRSTAPLHTVSDLENPRIIGLFNTRSNMPYVFRIRFTVAEKLSASGATQERS